MEGEKEKEWERMNQQCQYNKAEKQQKQEKGKEMEKKWQKAKVKVEEWVSSHGRK